MGYIIICQGQIPLDDGGRDYFEGWYSGIVHKTREDARNELASIKRAEREHLGIVSAWIEEIEE